MTAFGSWRAVKWLARGCSNDFTAHFPQITAALAVLPVRSCPIDGEAIVWNEAGLVVFELVRRQRHGPSAVLCTFDLLEFDGRDMR